jgi:hypothetical protein
MENKGLKHLLLNNNKPTDMELWFRSFLVGLETRIEPNKSYSVYYEKDGETLFELYKPNNCVIPWFYVHNDKIWSVLSTNFGLNYTETQSFIKNVVEETLNIRGVAPNTAPTCNSLWWKIP